jgi:hypothetical protein
MRRVASTSTIANPLLTTPARPRPSARRTSHIDMVTLPDSGLQLSGGARDLHTTAEGESVVAEAQVTALLDRGRSLEQLETTPADERTDALMGLLVGRGFRAAVDAALPEPTDVASPLYLLLDDLPVAALISGYGALYTGQLPKASKVSAQSMVMSDICSGWRDDGAMMVSLRTKGRIPVPVGPTNTDLVPDEDPLAWHEIGDLPVGAMRRKRLVEVAEVAEGEPLPVFAMFRDTYVTPDGTEMVLHEYALTAELTPGSPVLTRCEAEPRVLPWNECPAAADSARRLDGLHVDEVRKLVAKEFKGTTTCTHLNDLLRSLADLGTLAALLS